MRSERSYGEEIWIEYHDDLGRFHREDGPAAECIKGMDKGCKYYYIHGMVHRENGPAILENDYESYWFNGIKYPFEDWKEIIKYKAFL